MKTIAQTITKRNFKKVLVETLRDNPDILEERLLHYPYSFNVATKDDIKMLIGMMDKRFKSLQRKDG